MQHPNPWYLWEGSLSNFLLSLLDLGTVLEVSMVGAFDKEERGRGSRRDIDLPLHRDGVFSQALADIQGGFYVEKPGIDVVGLYCLRNNNFNPCPVSYDHMPHDYCDGTPSTKRQCLTILQREEDILKTTIELKEGQGLVFDNNKLLHGRKGPVGERILMRGWLKKKEDQG